jgi:hypothetical protein
VPRQQRDFDRDALRTLFEDAPAQVDVPFDAPADELIGFLAELDESLWTWEQVFAADERAGEHA